MTTSSLGMLRRSLTGPYEGMIGEPLAIRSDEWLTAAPIELATLANGSSMTSPLSNGPDLIYQVSSGSPLESLLFLEGNLLRLGEWLPDAMLFAAFRGYHWLLLALFLPPLLRRLGANRPMSWLAVVLCFLAPSAVWWSFMPIRILGLAAAGCYVVVLASERLVRRQWVRGFLLAALAGILLARLVTYYVPWSLTIGVPLVLATGLFLVRERAGRRSALLAVGVGATVALTLLIGVFWENWDALHAELNTVYPGQRRSTGTALPPYWLFGAPGLFELERFAALPGPNQSEVSTAYLLCGLVALLLWPAVRRTLPRREKAAIFGLALVTGCFVAWTIFNWGAVGRSLPGLSAIMPGRAAQTVGFAAAIAMCLVLSAWAKQPATAPAGKEEGVGDRRSSRALTVAVVAAVVTGYAVADLTRVIPELPLWQVWLATAVTAVLVWTFVRFPASWVPVALAATVSLAAHVDANPIMFGLGEVRTSAAADRAREFRAQEVASGTRMVTDNMAANALLVANGVPLLSGYQVTGPVAEQWEFVDPDRRYERVWNRGASYLLFAFDKPPGAPPEIIEAHNDVVRVHTDACWLASSPFRISRIVAEVPVRSACTTRVGKFTWNGVTQYVYRLAEA
ncbi:MAG TPA: hypothetical protein VGE38_04670 [Nocardioides sp.]